MLSYSTLTLILLFFLQVVWPLISHLRSKPKSPPGPRPLPIIGNLHILTNPHPHRTLSQLAKTYGDIMSLRLGSIPTVVVSSPKAAELFLKTHDAIFANRPKVQAYDYLSFGSKGVAFTEYGPYWRDVRRLCAVELLSTAKVDSFASMRREELGLLVESLQKSAAARQVVNVSVKVAELIEDMTYRMVFGSGKQNRFDWKAVIREATSLAGAFNLADYMPWLRLLDLQGLTRRLKEVHRLADKILEDIINEHEQETTKHQATNYRSFIDVMVSLNTMNRTNIKAILLDMLVGTIETSAIAIEWTLSELLKHPRVMVQVKNELTSVIGPNRKVEEKDLAKLAYLDMVLKESFRLHVSPFLVPHESTENVIINNFYIAKNTRIIINAWAIGRDPEIWSENAQEFIPERFIGNNVDIKGHDFQLIPFGSGRRGCPGIQLGLTMVKLVLAQLVHCFDWELPNGMEPNDLDMSERFGLTMPRENHLLAMPTYRLIDNELLN